MPDETQEVNCGPVAIPVHEGATLRTIAGLAVEADESGVFCLAPVWGDKALRFAYGVHVETPAAGAPEAHPVPLCEPEDTALTTYVPVFDNDA